MPAPKPTRLFHITAMVNLAAICKAGALAWKNHDCRAHPPVLELCAHRLGEQFDPLASLAHGAAILGKGDFLCGTGEVHHETNGATEYLVFRTGKRHAGRRHTCLICLVRP